MNQPIGGGTTEEKQALAQMGAAVLLGLYSAQTGKGDLAAAIASLKGQSIQCNSIKTEMDQHGVSKFIHQAAIYSGTKTYVESLPEKLFKIGKISPSAVNLVIQYLRVSMGMLYLKNNQAQFEQEEVIATMGQGLGFDPAGVSLEDMISKISSNLMPRFSNQSSNKEVPFLSDIIGAGITYAFVLAFGNSLKKTLLDGAPPSQIQVLTRNMEQEYHTLILEYVVAAAWADNVLKAEEEEFLTTIASHLGAEASLVKGLIDKKAPISAIHTPDDKDLKEFIMALVIGVIVSEYEVHEKEIGFLQDLCNKFSFTQPTFEGSLAKFKSMFPEFKLSRNNSQQLQTVLAA